MLEDCPATEKRQPAAPMQQILETLATTNSPKFGPYFRRMREAFPEELARVCIRHIATHEPGPAEKRMAVWLSSDETYLTLIIGSDLLNSHEAQNAAKVLKDVDPKFFVKLSQFTDGTHRPVDPVVLARALNLLEATGDYTALVPRLNALTNHADERIRSKAVKALCGLRPNKALLKRQLQSDDARVRANAIEGIWHMQSEEASDIFREALSDNNHRVVVNALLGLHYQKDQWAIDRLLELANHSSAPFRAAVAWAFGRILDHRAVPVLELLAKDPSDMVQKRALQVLSQFPIEILKEPAQQAQETTPAVAKSKEGPQTPPEPANVPSTLPEPVEPDVKKDDSYAPSFRLF